jgi:hypothetical protein
MGWSSRVLLIVTLVLGAASAAMAQKELALLATIDDPRGETASLDPKDVHVTEDGNAANVVRVDPVHRIPKVQILIDNGVGFPATSIGDLRTAMRALIDALPPTVEVTLVTTAPQPRFLERATADHQKLLKAVDRLTPDSGAGRFVESLAEAVDRIARDKQDASYTIFTLATTSGDMRVSDGDVSRILKGVESDHPTVHAVVLERTSARDSGTQIDIAEMLTRSTGGRMEVINVPGRLLTLMPDVGADIAKACGPQAKQFRITFERPAAARGRVGQLALGVRGLSVSSLAMADVPR